MLQSADKYNNMRFCPPPFPLSPKSADTDVNLSVRLQLIHHHGTGDLLYAKHPGLLCFTTASAHLYSGWRWGAISRPNVQTDQQSLFLSRGPLLDPTFTPSPTPFFGVEGPG